MIISTPKKEPAMVKKRGDKSLCLIPSCIFSAWEEFLPALAGRLALVGVFLVFFEVATIRLLYHSLAGLSPLCSGLAIVPPPGPAATRSRSGCGASSAPSARQPRAYALPGVYGL